MKKGILYLIILITMMFLHSCRTTYMVKHPLENQYREKFEGKSYAYIMRNIGIPNRTVSDGSGGKILIYEKRSYTTTTNTQNFGYGNVNTNISGQSNGYATANVYGYVDNDYYSAHGSARAYNNTNTNVNTNAYANNNTTTTTTSSEENSFLHCYINSNDICYLIRTNYYTTTYEDRIDGKKTLGITAGGILALLCCIIPFCFL